jgi:uncharacterized membrane protein
MSKNKTIEKSTFNERKYHQSREWPVKKTNYDNWPDQEVRKKEKIPFSIYEIIGYLLILIISTYLAKNINNFNALESIAISLVCFFSFSYLLRIIKKKKYTSKK